MSFIAFSSRKISSHPCGAIATLLFITALSSSSVPQPMGASQSDRANGMVDPVRAAVHRADTVATARISRAYGQLPLSFEANQGQTNSQIDFLARGSGYTLFVSPR
jgi:hypothetical protein